jgi:hypothetical protein
MDLQRLEMVWARKPRTHKMWNRGARLTVRLSRLTSRENDKAVLSLTAREAVGKASRPELAPNALKRLNPGAEIVWPRKPPTYKIWYAVARLTVRGSG